MSKQSSLLQKSVNYDRKKFYNTCPCNDLDQLWIFAIPKNDLLLINLTLSTCTSSIPHLIRLLGFYTQAFQLGFLITFVNTFCFNFNYK